MLEFPNKAPKASFNVGDIVMIVNSSASSKTEPKYHGPYRVVARTPNGAYRLLNSTGALLSDTLPPSLLKKVSSTTSPSPTPSTLDTPPSSSSAPPSPPMVPMATKGLPSGHYEILHVLDHAGPPGDCQYKVRWKGYSAKDDLWLDERNLNADRAIRNYWKDLKKNRANTYKKGRK